jgi:hypothetical protein
MVIRRLSFFVFPLFLFLLNAGCAHRDVSACFYDFTEVLEQRVYNVLSNAPGVSGITRLWSGCEGDKKCLCYEVRYKGAIDELSSWLRHELRTSPAVPFRLTPVANNRLEVYFDGGFD